MNDVGSRGSGNWLIAAWTPAGGAIVATLGVGVLIGWLTGTPALFQIVPTLAPMQYNEALGFLLAGASLLSLSAGRPMVARVAAAILIVIAGTTLVQYVTGIDAGIDELLMRSWVTVGTSHPGRMAPNTAVCFTLAGVGLLLVARGGGRRADAVAATFGTTVASLGILALAGYLTAEPAAYGWGELTAMAVLAAIGMIVMGTAIMARAWRTSVSTNQPSPSWLPLAVGLAGLTTTLCLWQANIRPAAATLSRNGTGGAAAVLIVGIIMSALLAFLLRFGQEADRRAAEVAVANEDLEREISHRAVIERALRDSERHYRDLAELSLGYIWIHDFDGRLLMVNAAAAQALGYEADDIVGRGIAEFVAPAMRAEVEQYLARMRVQDELRGTVTIVTSTGDERIWSFSNIRYTEDGTPVHVLANAQDITALKAAEAEVAKSRDSAVESARLKSEFLANMSHEIRTPLNGVIGMTDLLLTTPLSSEQHEYSDTIRASADSLLTIVNDILDFSKIEAGMLSFESLDFSLRNMVESTVEMFSGPAKQKKIDLATLVYSDVPDALRGDPGRVRQVLTNLLGNAVKFTLAGEVSLRVTVEQDTVDEAVIRFSIADTGIGISRNQQERLFQPFVQADGSTAREFGGTGLGLAISRQLVERMQGEIGVDSQPGIGSTFTFTARFERQPADQSGFEENVTLEGLRVLIVDDNETNRAVVHHYVTAWGMESGAASGGSEALNTLRDAQGNGRPFDIALLDLMMPGMTGFELARRIKLDPDLSNVRLVLMPAFGKRGHANDAREAGIAAYLVKPVRQSELRECLLAIASDRPSPDHKPTRLVTRHTLTESSRKPQRRILIAEDNLVNQKVLMAQVAKLGYRADLVNNGEEALSAMDRYPYALVLMDCHMPLLDGYQTVRTIRERENGRRRTPIIAITANAMSGEREKCVVAGMDDYLPKPLRQDDLAAALERWMPEADDDGASTQPDVYGDPGIIHRAAEINSGVGPIPGGNARDDGTAATVRRRVDELRTEVGAEVLASLVEMFLADAMSRIEKLHRELAVQDAAAVHETAHALKGSCLNFGADVLARLCAEIEDLSEAGRLRSVGSLLGKLDSEYEAVRAELESFAPAA